MGKFKYAKCPYCGEEFKNDGGVMCKLACNGWMKEACCKCPRCGRNFIVTVKIMYYGRKLSKKEEALYED